jgi:hypothetical protein
MACVTHHDACVCREAARAETAVRLHLVRVTSAVGVDPAYVRGWNDAMASVSFALDGPTVAAPGLAEPVADLAAAEPISEVDCG